MTEKELEMKWLRCGTVKRKADLLQRTGVSPNKLRHALKKFGVGLPETLYGAPEYAVEFFDFLLDFDGDYYEKYPERNLLEDVVDYVMGEVWIIKHKTRTIENDSCIVALDVRKCFKDHAANIAQITGRVMKNRADGLPVPERKELRQLFMDSADEVAEATFGEMLKRVELLPRQIT